MTGKEKPSADIDRKEAEVEVERENGPEEAVLEPTHEELGLLLEDARAKVDEHHNQLLRTQAELENLRRRNARELENAHKFALEKFVSELLPVRDSMEMGIGAAGEAGVDPDKLREGVDLTLKMFESAMEKFGIRAVDPEGEKFNPDLHQAMSMQEAAEVESNTVLTVVQKGYLLNDRLVRPALVIVATGGRSKAEAPEGGAGEYGAEPGEGGGQVDERA